MKNSTPAFLHKALSAYGKILFTVILWLGNFIQSNGQSQTVTFATPGTVNWTAPCGVTSVNIQIWGAGGGGGNASSFSTGSAAGGGGGGGAFRTATNITVLPSATYSIVIGSGGIGNTDGGNSSGFGLTAQGGEAGESATAILWFSDFGAGGNGGAAPSFAGGNGASGSVGNFGGGGGSGSGTAIQGNNASGAIAGTAPAGGGNGGNGRTGGTGNGTDGTTTGGGGGGGFASGVRTGAGGRGGDGLVIITYTGMSSLSCTPGFTTVTPLRYVELNGISNLTNNSTANDWEQFCTTFTVTAGLTYPLITRVNTSGNFTDHVTAYFDWNNDGDFNDSGEDFQIGTATNGNNALISGNINVPLTATTGITRMRVVKRRGGYIPGPCQSGTQTGQAEDYLLNILPLPACTTPSNPTGLNINFQASPVYSINGSFTGSGASGYIVIQTTGATAPLTPTNGIVYPAGSNTLGGTVIYNGTSTSFSSTSIFQNQQYCFWVYAYNNICAGAPFYSTGNTNNCVTTPSCNTAAEMTLTGNETKNWNLASSWSPEIVPSSCTHVTIRYTAINSNTQDLASSIINANFNIRSLTIIGNFNNAGVYNPGIRQKLMQLTNNGFSLNIQDSLQIIAEGGIDQLATGNHLNSHSITFNSTGNSILNVYGNTYIGGPDDEKLSILGSTSGNPAFYFWGNVTYNKYANTAPNGTYVFEKNGTAAQTLTNNITSANSSLRLLYQHMKVGESGTSFPALTLTGGTGALKSGINGGDLTIKTGASLNLPNGTGLSQHTSGSSGVFTMNGTAQLFAGGTTSNSTHNGATYSGYAGNNFPFNFGSYILSNNSTVHYNSNGGLHQTIYPTVTYGNLVLSVGDGASVVTNKTLNANITGITGNLSVQPYATFNMQLNNANRTSTGGTFILAAHANLSLGGNTGGAGPNNNFPDNFNSKVFAANSNTYYNFNGAQGIYGDVDYGNLFLSVNGGKTAPAVLNINGNLTINGTANFVHNSGNVLFNAASNAQHYSAVTPAIFYNLYNNNTHTSGLSVLNNLSVANELGLSSNTALFLTGDVILLSNAGSTASVAVLPSTAQVDYSGGGRFEIQRFIQHYQKWNLIGVPLRNTTSLRTTWQENGITGPSVTGLGTQITGPGGGNGLDAGSSSASFKWWNAASQSFTNITNTNTEIANRTEGYYAFVRGDRNFGPGGAGNTTTLRARGEIYTGANPPAAYTRSGLSASAFVSVANPYASAIDFADVYAAATNIKPGFHVWDPTLTTSGSLGSYQHITNTGIITPGTGLYTAAHVGAGYKNIQSGQVIYFEPASAGSVTIPFAESHKTTGSRQLNRRELEDPAMLSSMLHNGNGQLIDGNRVMFNDDFSDQSGNEDAAKLLNSGENFGLLSYGRRLIVEGRKPVNAGDTIYYNMSNLRNQDYRLSFEPRHLNTNGITAELIDNFLNTRTPVSLTDSSFYNFTVNSNAQSKAPGRFMLVFRPATVLPVTFINISAQAKEDRTHAIQWRIANEINILQYELERSGDGRIFNTILSFPSAGETYYSKTDLSPLIKENFYRIKAIGFSNEITYSPVVKINNVKMNSFITVVNPVVSKQLNIRFEQQIPGNYTIDLIAVGGQKVQSKRTYIGNAPVYEIISLESVLTAGSYNLLIKNEKGNIVYNNTLLIQ